MALKRLFDLCALRLRAGDSETTTEECLRRPEVSLKLASTPGFETLIVENALMMSPKHGIVKGTQGSFKTKTPSLANMESLFIVVLNLLPFPPEPSANYLI